MEMEFQIDGNITCGSLSDSNHFLLINRFKPRVLKIIKIIR